MNEVTLYIIIVAPAVILAAVFIRITSGKWY